MSVSQTRQVNVYPLNRIDVRFPIGKWYGQEITALAGDASGGTAQIKFVISKTPHGALFSVDWWGMYINAPVVGSVQHVYVSFNTGETQPGNVDLELSEGHDSLAPASNAVPLVLSSKLHPAFGGYIARPITSIDDSYLILRTDNVLGEQYQPTCWGYVWDPAALKMAGGPIRPGQWLPEMKILPT